MRKIYPVYFLIGFLLIATNIFSQTSENIQSSKDNYTKFSFLTYGLKSKEQAQKLESEYRSKSGIFFVKIDFNTKESVVITKVNIKARDIGEVARMADCKIDNIQSERIDQKKFEELTKGVK